jgi:hypothetical protein
MFSFLPINSIVMARHALFPETILYPAEAVGLDGEEKDGQSGKDEELEDLLNELTKWDFGGSETSFKDSTFASFETPVGDVLTDELQVWRKDNMEKPYEQWSEEKKKGFMVSALAEWFSSF